MDWFAALARLTHQALSYLSHESVVMRIVVGIALFLIGLGLFLGQVESATFEKHYEAESIDWVRTAQGWERAAAWSTMPVGVPQLHPLVVAAGQGFVSLLALVACATSRPIETRRLWEMVLTGQ